MVDIHKSFVDLYYTILQLRSLVGEKSKFSDVSGRVSSKIIIPKFRWKSSTLFSNMNEKVACTMERNMHIDLDYVYSISYKIIDNFLPNLMEEIDHRERK